MIRFRIALVVFAFSVQAFAADHTEEYDYLLREGALYTFAGIKPVTEVMGAGVPPLLRELAKMRRQGRLGKNIGWFKPWNSSASTPLVRFYNLKSLEHMKADPQISAMLEPYGFYSEDTAETWLRKYKAWHRRPHIPYQQQTPGQIYDNQTVEGLFFGYAPNEVWAWSAQHTFERQGFSDEQTLRLTGIGENVHGIRTGNQTNYWVGTNMSEDYNRWFLKSSQDALKNYDRLRKKGLSPLDVIAKWNRVVGCETYLVKR